MSFETCKRPKDSSRLIIESQKEIIILQWFIPIRALRFFMSDLCTPFLFYRQQGSNHDWYIRLEQWLKADGLVLPFPFGSLRAWNIAVKAQKIVSCKTVLRVGKSFWGWKVKSWCSEAGHQGKCHIDILKKPPQLQSPDNWVLVPEGHFLYELLRGTKKPFGEIHGMVPEV